MLTFLVILSIVIIPFYFFWKRPEKNTALKQIPNAPAIDWPIFGHLIALSKSPLKSILKWHKQVGPIYKLKLGNQLWIMIGDPYLAHEIFMKSGSTTSSRPYHRFATNSYAKGNRGIVFSQYGNIWKNNRKTVTSLLKPSSVDEYKDLMAFEVNDLMDRFSRIAKKEISVNPYNDLQLCSLNVVLQLSLNRRLESTDDSLYQKLGYVVDALMYYCGIVGDIVTFLPLFSWADKLFGLEKAKMALDKEVRDVYGKLIQDAHETNGSFLVKTLYKIKEKDNLMTDNDIEVILRDFVGAGSDTIAATLYWSLVCISQHPKVQDKLVQELDEWKIRNPSRDFPDFNKDREDFPYSLCVQKEAMRFRPVTPLGIPHACTKDTIVDGYLIPEGATLISNIAAMHQNPAIYEDPELFKPERFLNKTQKMSVLANSTVQERDHFGFGWGRRMCPGLYVAEIEIFNFYVRFFTKFNVLAELDKEGNRKRCLDFREVGIKTAPALEKLHIISRIK